MGKRMRLAFISYLFLIATRAQCSSLLLNLSRLDTLANVFINGELVLRSTNMFQLHRIDIKPFAVLGDNRIEIHFSRADEEGKQRANTLPMPIPWASAITKFLI